MDRSIVALLAEPPDPQRVGEFCPGERATIKGDSVIDFLLNRSIDLLWKLPAPCTPVINWSKLSSYCIRRPGIDAWLQSPELEERQVYQSFRKGFDTGADRVILLRENVPGIHLDDIQRSIEILDENQVVIGPCSRGGCYLIGARNREVLTTIPREFDWNTIVSFEELSALMQEKQVSFQLIEQRTVIKNVDDWRAWKRRNPVQFV